MKKTMGIDANADCQQERPDVARVELGLSGDRVTPAEVTAATGLLPSRSWSKGETYESMIGVTRARPFGIWVITFEGTEVEQCSRGLLAIVEPWAEAIRQVARTMGATVSVGIWWEPEGGQGGFTVSSDILRRLSELGDRVDVYFPG
jgi:Domain of unknown function (DUF4279)